MRLGASTRRRKSSGRSPTKVVYTGTSGCRTVRRLKQRERFRAGNDAPDGNRAIVLLLPLPQVRASELRLRGLGSRPSEKAVWGRRLAIGCVRPVIAAGSQPVPTVGFLWGGVVE